MLSVTSAYIHRSVVFVLLAAMPSKISLVGELKLLYSMVVLLNQTISLTFDGSLKIPNHIVACWLKYQKEHMYFNIRSACSLEEGSKSFCLKLSNLQIFKSRIILLVKALQKSTFLRLRELIPMC